MKSDKKLLDNIKAIIWDMDGVVINSEGYHVKTEINTLKELGIKITPEMIKEYLGLSITEYFKVLSKRFGVPIKINEVLKHHSKMLADFKNNDVLLFDGIIEVLEELSRKYKLGLATGSPKFFKQAVFDRYRLKKFFIASLADEEVKQGKPDPEIYLKIAKLLNVTPKDCVVIEDSDNGIKAAHAAGMKVIAHRAEHNRKSDLSKADFEVKSILDIPSVIERINTGN